MASTRSQRPDSTSADGWLHHKGGRDASWHRDRRTPAEQQETADRLSHQRASFQDAEREEAVAHLSGQPDESREAPRTPTSTDEQQNATE